MCEVWCFLLWSCESAGFGERRERDTVWSHGSWLRLINQALLHELLKVYGFCQYWCIIYDIWYNSTPMFCVNNTSLSGANRNYIKKTSTFKWTIFSIIAVVTCWGETCQNPVKATGFPCAHIPQLCEIFSLHFFFFFMKFSVIAANWEQL